QNSQLLPVPVLPVISSPCPRRTHSPLASVAISRLSSLRSERQVMSSTQAWECFRRAWRKSRVVRPFSRFNRSRSTSSPKRSSKDRLAVLGFWSCSSKAAIMPWSFRLLNVSRVGLLSIEFSFFSVVIARPAHVAVQRQGEFIIGCARGAPIEATLEERLHAVASEGADFDGARRGGLEPLGAVLPGEREEPEAGAITLFGVRLG